MNWLAILKLVLMLAGWILKNRVHQPDAETTDLLTVIGEFHDRAKAAAAARANPIGGLHDDDGHRRD